MSLNIPNIEDVKNEIPISVELKTPKTPDKWYRLLHMDNRSYNLRMEYYPNIKEYGYHLHSPHGISFLMLSHTNSIDDYDRDLFDKLRNEFEQNNILTLPEELEEVKSPKKFITEPISQNTANDGEIHYRKLEHPLSHYLYTYFEYLFPGNGKKGVVMWSAGLSTARGEPFHIVTQGDTGDGKTFLEDMVCECIPPEHITVLEEATKPYVFTKAKMKGFDDHYLDKQVVRLGDLGSKNAFENTEPLRQILNKMTTDGKANRGLTEGSDKDKTATDEKLYGKPCMWYTTVREDSDDQELDRSLIITPNLKYMKTVKKIIKLLKGPKIGKTTTILQELKEKWIPKFHAIFNYLIGVEIEPINPYDMVNNEYRFRTLNRIINVSNCVALMDHRWRYTAINFLLVHESDINLGVEIIESGLESKGSLSEKQIKRLERLREYFKTNKFAANDAQPLFPSSYKDGPLIRRYLLDPAVDMELIKRDDSQDYGKAYLYYFELPDSDGVSLEGLNVTKKLTLVLDDDIEYEYGITYHEMDIPKMGIVKELDKPNYMDNLR